MNACYARAARCCSRISSSAYIGRWAGRIRTYSTIFKN